MADNLDRFAAQLQAKIIEDLKNVYSPVVLDHWQKPRNLGEMKDPDGRGKVTGSCGDTMIIAIKVKEDRISDTKFLTDGCGTTIACGSIVTKLIKDKPIDKIKKMDDKSLLDACGGLPEEDQHCAALTIETLKAAIKDYETNPERKGH